MFKKLLQEWLGIEEQHQKTMTKLYDFSDRVSMQIDDMDKSHQDKLLEIDKKYAGRLNEFWLEPWRLQEKEAETRNQFNELYKKINAIYEHFGLEEKIVPASPSKVILSKKKNVEG